MVEPMLGDPSDEYLDPATGEGLQAGLLQATLQGLLLVLVFVLSVLLGTLDLATVLGAPDPVALLGGLAGVAVGAGSIARLHSLGLPAWLRQLGWRLVSNVCFVLGFTALLLVVPATAFVAAVGYLVGRVGAHLAVYTVG